MEPKYYVPENCHWLAVSDTKGSLTETDLTWNLMRMLVMSEEEVGAKEAFKILDEMEREPFEALQRRAEALLYDPEMQEYLERENVKVGQRLYPVEDEEKLMDYLDEMDWASFQQWEMPEAEYD
jgi:hypothetical protein